MNEKDFFERGLRGEPPLAVDFAAVRSGARAIRRRRRRVAVSGVVAAAIFILGAAALIPRLSAAEPAAAQTIPGCAVVLGSTGAGAPAASGQPPPTLESASTISTVSPRATGSSSTAASPEPGSTASPTLISVEPTTPTADANADMDAPPDALTGTLWKSLESWNVAVHTVSQYGTLQFQVAYSGSEPVAANASGRVTSALGDGELMVAVQADGGGVPDCHLGELDSRVTRPDGTVVDLIQSASTASSNLSSDEVAIIQRHAVAYHPDGTTVIVAATNALQLGDDDASQAGTYASPGAPLTIDQVVELASDPAFSVDSPAFADAAEHGLVAVPNVVGLSEADAVAVLDEAGFAGQLSTSGSSPADTRVVIGQAPAAGVRTAPYGGVSLTVGPTTGGSTAESAAGVTPTAAERSPDPPPSR